MVEYVIKQKYPLKKLPQAEGISNWMFSAMVEIDSRIALEGYLEQLARLLNLPVDALKFDFSKFLKNRTPNYKQPFQKNFHLVS